MGSTLVLASSRGLLPLLAKLAKGIDSTKFLRKVKPFTFLESSLENILSHIFRHISTPIYI